MAAAFISWKILKERETGLVRQPIDKLGLALKMSDKLSVLLGYGITDNTGATSPVKKVDTIATVSLGYSF